MHLSAVFLQDITKERLQKGISRLALTHVVRVVRQSSSDSFHSSYAGRHRHLLRINSITVRQFLVNFTGVRETYLSSVAQILAVWFKRLNQSAR